MTIKEQCRAIHTQVDELNTQLEQLKSICPHTDVLINKNMTYLGDPFHKESHRCLDCGKYWITQL